MSTHTARSFAPREKGGGFRRKAYAAALVGALSLFSWGCGNSGNNDFVASGTVTASPSPIIIVPTPTPSPTVPPASPTPTPASASATFQFTNAKITVNNSASVTSYSIQFLDATNAVIPGVGFVSAPYPPAGNSVTVTIPGTTAPLIKSVRITFFAANGSVVSGVQQAFTIAPGQSVADAVTATAATATLTAVTVQPPSATINATGGNQTFTAQGTFNVTGFTSPVVNNITGVTFSSSNASVATVNGTTGVATAVANGSTFIVATSGNVSSNTTNGNGNLTVALTGPPASPTPTPSPSGNVTISPASVQLAVNATQQLTVAINGTNQTANTTFSSSNASVATVSASGLVTAVSVGTSSIGAVVNVNGNLTTAPNATVTVNNGTISTGLLLNPSTATTVVGGRVNITGTVNGTTVPLTLTVANNATAQVQGQTLVGLAAGTTNFTATSATGNLTATGTLTVATGASLTGMVIDAGASGFTMAEGDQRQFRALAQFTVSGGGTAQSDVTQQAVWFVNQGAAGDTGTIVSFEPATAGNFTALKGTGGTAQVGCIFMDGTRTVVTNQQTLTINKSTPTITINPVGVPTETNNSPIPATGWTRGFQARATYPSSGFSRTLGGTDSVSWSVIAGNALFQGAASATQIQQNTIVALSGQCELQSLIVPVTSLSVANTGTAILNVVYGGAASPTTAAANDNINVTNYTLIGATASLAPGLANDKNAIAFGNTAGQYGRPVTVVGSFKAVPSTASFSYPLYTSPGVSAVNPNGLANGTSLRAGTLSLYLPATGANSANAGAVFFGGAQPQQDLFNYNRLTQNTAAFLTTAISPVGFSQFIKITTTTTGVQGALQIRVNHVTTSTGALNSTIGTTGDQTLNGLTSTVNQATSDRDQARTATIAGVTLEKPGTTTFLFNSTVVGSAMSPGIPTNINRDSGLNIRLICQYSTGTLSGVQEDVTNLFGTQFGVGNNSGSSSATGICYDFVDNGAQFNLNAPTNQPLNSTGRFVANAAGAPAVTGLTRGQVLVTSNQTAVANQALTVGAKYPHAGYGAAGANTCTADKTGNIIVNVP